MLNGNKEGLILMKEYRGGERSWEKGGIYLDHQYQAFINKSLLSCI